MGVVRRWSTLPAAELAERLSGLQRHVLYVLANRGACSAVDRTAWTPLDVGSARRAIYRLANHGLVDVAGFEYNGGREVRTYALTARGHEVVRQLTEGELRSARR